MAVLMRWLQVDSACTENMRMILIIAVLLSLVYLLFCDASSAPPSPWSYQLTSWIPASMQPYASEKFDINGQLTQRRSIKSRRIPTLSNIPPAPSYTTPAHFFEHFLIFRRFFLLDGELCLSVALFLWVQSSMLSHLSSNLALSALVHS